MRPAVPSPSPSPSDRARAALLDDSTRSNREIALAARCTATQAASVRRALEDRAVIPPNRAPPPARFPGHVPMPRSPRVLTEGLCVANGHPSPDAWAEPRHPDRELARMLCIEACHVQQICLSWALRAVPVSDTAIYGGATRSQRTVLRRQRGITRPNATTAINARKTCCPECGLPLSGENLITEPGRLPARCAAAAGPAHGPARPPPTPRASSRRHAPHEPHPQHLPARPRGRCRGCRRPWPAGICATHPEPGLWADRGGRGLRRSALCRACPVLAPSAGRGRWPSDRPGYRSSSSVA